MKAISFNDMVYFKPTKKLLDHISYLNSHHPVFSLSNIVLNQKDGYSYCELWMLARITGDILFHGQEALIEDNEFFIDSN